MLKNTKLSFALRLLRNATTNNSAALDTRIKILKRHLFTKWLEIKSSTCFILKLNGVPTTKSTTKLSVYMLITGKTSEENQTCFSIIHSRCVNSGKLEISLAVMQKVVSYKAFVEDAMDGKNKFFIQWSTKQSIVKMQSCSIQIKSNTVSRTFSAVTITVKLIGDSHPKVSYIPISCSHLNWIKLILLVHTFQSSWPTQTT